MIRPESITVIIHPPEAGTDDLSVSDAMQQVLDAFELLSKAEAERRGSKERVVWKLERASTNSPLTIEARAVSSDPEGEISGEARQAKITFKQGIESILRAKEVPAWMDTSARKTVRRLLERTLQNVGRTDIISDDFTPVLIDHRSANRAILFLDRIAAEEAQKVEDLARIEYGAIEGNVTGTTTHYGRPAIKIRLRLSGSEVKCVLSDVAAAKIGPSRNWAEVWAGQRVLVRGRIQYNSAGKVLVVNAEDLDVIQTRNVSLTEIRADGSASAEPDNYMGFAWSNQDG